MKNEENMKRPSNRINIPCLRNMISAALWLGASNNQQSTYQNKLQNLSLSRVYFIFPNHKLLKRTAHLNIIISYSISRVPLTLASPWYYDNVFSSHIKSIAPQQEAQKQYKRGSFEHTFSTSFEEKIDQGYLHLGLGHCIMLALDGKKICLAR